MIPSEKNGYTVRFVEWDSYEAEAVKMIRFCVFVDEQKVPADLEMDEIDGLALHLLAENKAGDPCGTGRLFPDPENSSVARIGRMAVLKEHRGSGCGAAIMTALLNEARKSYQKVMLSAQLHAVRFYQRFGFEPTGPLYDDAGIPHQLMTLQLTSFCRKGHP